MSSDSPPRFPHRLLSPSSCYVVDSAVRPCSLFSPRKRRSPRRRPARGSSMEYLVPIVVALLGLAGTIAGLIFAYRKWLREQQAEHSKAFRTDRQAAYKQLWELAE